MSNDCLDFVTNLLWDIPSVFRRLVFLAGRRDFQSGRYQDPTMASKFGAEAVHVALAELHTDTFSLWMRFSQSQQKERPRPVPQGYQRRVPARWWMCGSIRRYAPNWCLLKSRIESPSSGGWQCFSILIAVEDVSPFGKSADRGLANLNNSPSSGIFQ